MGREFTPDIGVFCGCISSGCGRRPRHCPIVPIFPDAEARPVVRNKANCLAKQSQSAAARCTNKANLPAGGQGRVWGRSYKQSQLSRGVRKRARTGGAGNELCGVNHAKQSQFASLCRSGDRRSRREGQSCETKPICRVTTARAAGRQGFGETKPICGRTERDESRQDYRYHRSGAATRNKANLPCLGRDSRRRAGLRQNKANFRTDRKGQEPTRPPVPTAWAIVRNKANSPAPAAQRRRGQGHKRNKANSRPSGRPDGPGIRHRMPGTPPVTDNLGKSLTGTTGCAIFTKLIDARVECGPRADCASEMPRLDGRACSRTVPRGAIRKSADGSTLSSNTLCSNWNWGSIHTRK